MKFSNNVFIKYPVEQVFEFVSDFSNNAEWQTDILDLEVTSEGRFGIGSTYRCVNRFMGKRIETQGRITEYEPDRRFCIEINSGPITGSSVLSFEALNGGTLFTTSGSLDLSFFKLARLLVKRKVNQQLKYDMLKLKEVLENRTGQEAVLK